MVISGIIARLRYQYRTDPWTFALSVVVLAVGMVLLFDLTWRLMKGDIAISRFVRNVWSGIVFGMAIGLAGIGLAMTYSILKFPNFAHGEYLTLLSRESESPVTSQGRTFIPFRYALRWQVVGPKPSGAPGVQSCV